MLTEVQIAWISSFLALGASKVAGLASGEGKTLATGPSPEAEPGGGEPAARTRTGASDTRALSLPSLPSIPDIPDPGIKVHITITNQSGHDLDLVSSKLENPSGSEFETPPPESIGGDKDSATIVVSNNAPFLTGVGGSTTYRLSDEPGTTVTFQWDRGRVPKRKAVMTISPDDPKRFEKDQGFDGDNFSFTLKSKGKKPGGKDAGVTLSCRVAVVNQTKQVVFLRKQDNAAGGDFVTNPATSLAPGASSSFVYAETPNTDDHKCRGTMSWDIGDPKLGAWSMMWDNQKGAKNLSASFLAPDGSGFHTLDQIDEGDENVPVTFTLSGGGGTAPTAKPASCAITVINQTQAVLTRVSVLANSGKFETQPPGTIERGQSAQFVFTGPDDPAQGADGAVQWSVGETKSIAWQTSWRKPPSSAVSKIAPDGSGFTGTGTASDGADGTALVVFTLTGGGQPPPEEADDDFAPPPKSKQPTLRLKDESPDGWVEYAQRLLNKWGVEKGLPKETVNGVFNPDMAAKVKAFQLDRGCQQDGVIGNETWSMLREGQKEKVGTDHRKPHTFEQKDAQARFVTEQTDSTGYRAAEDEYFMRIVSVGEQPIDKFQGEVRVIQPDRTSHTHHFEIGPAKVLSDNNQGNFHILVINGFSKVFGLTKDPKKLVDPLTCTVDAYLPKEIGGDRWTGPVVAA